MLANVDVLTHSSIRIVGTKPPVVLYFDPYKITRSSRDADIIFFTHDHYDHFSPEDFQKIMRRETVVVCPYTMKNKVLQYRIPKAQIVPMLPGKKLSVCGISVEAVPAYNVGKPFHPKKNQWLGYVVTVDGMRYYIAGDTDQNEDNEKVQCDVALVPCGGTYTMNPREAAAFVNHLHPRAAIPTHYGTVCGTKEDGKLFTQYVDRSIQTLIKIV